MAFFLITDNDQVRKNGWKLIIQIVEFIWSVKKPEITTRKNLIFGKTVGVEITGSTETHRQIGNNIKNGFT